MEATPSGMVIVVKLEQYLNAEEPMDVTLSDIVIFVKLEQSENALISMEVTPSIILICVIDEDLQKLFQLTVFTISPMLTYFNFGQLKNQ